MRQLNEDQVEDGIHKLTISLSGNPWTDLGLVSLCHDLDLAPPSFLVEQPIITTGEVILLIDASQIEEMQHWFYQTIRDRWNRIFWLCKPAKVLGSSDVYDDEGFIEADENIQLTSEDQQFVHDKLDGAASETKKLYQRRHNFIGVLSDANKVKNGLADIVTRLAGEVAGLAIGAQICEICSRKNIRKQENASQFRNPLMNKHHNTQVRGFRKGNGYTRSCHICSTVNLFATLDDVIPFRYDSGQNFLVLPEVSDLDLLYRAYNRLSENVLQLGQKNQLQTSTNLRDCFSFDKDALTITLFHNLFYRFSVNQVDSSEGWTFSPIVNVNEVPKLTRWQRVEFVRKENIRVGNIHSIKINHLLYDLIRPIPMKDGPSLQLVPDILNQLSADSKRPDGFRALQRLYHSITSSQPKTMKEAVFLLWKYHDAIKTWPRSGVPHPIRLLDNFIQHFLEVNNVLNDELRGDLRALGTQIGSLFHRDVTLISKIYNISSENVFRAVLNQALFRFYKVGQKGEDQGDGKATPIKQERVTRILDLLTTENWKEMAETLSTFASLSAFNQSIFEKQKKGKE